MVGLHRSICLILLAAARAYGLEFSSAAISDPGQLQGPTLSPAASYQSLAVFPEQLLYNVSWGGIQVGQASLNVKEIVEFSSRPAYHITSQASSNKFWDAFYKVRDFNESWLDANTLSSLGYSKKLREGGYFRDEWVLYDTPSQRFLAKSISRDGSFSYQGGTVPVVVQDVLSSLYYIRAQKLTPGAEIILDVNTKKNWPLVVRIIKKEEISTPAGKFSTILVEPAIRQEGIFIQKGKHLQVWLSDDAKKVPVLLKVEVFFGHISARLLKML